VAARGTGRRCGKLRDLVTQSRIYRVELARG
jgi:hypothetical protein